MDFCDRDDTNDVLDVEGAMVEEDVLYLLYVEDHMVAAAVFVHSDCHEMDHSVAFHSIFDRPTSFHSDGRSSTSDMQCNSENVEVVHVHWAVSR